MEPEEPEAVVGSAESNVDDEFGVLSEAEPLPLEETGQPSETDAPAGSAEKEPSGSPEAAPEWSNFEEFKQPVGSDDGSQPTPEDTEDAQTGTPADSETVGTAGEATSASSSPTAADTNAPITVEIPKRPTSRQAGGQDTAGRSSLGSAKPGAAMTKKAQELFLLNKWMIQELTEQELFAQGKVRDWSRIHGDVKRRLGMAKRDHQKLAKIAAGSEMPPSPTSNKTGNLERGAVVFARWPLGGERDLGDMGEGSVDDADSRWHFGIFLGLDDFADDLARVKFLFPYSDPGAAERSRAKAEAAPVRASSTSHTAYPNQVARLAPINTGASTQSLIFPGRNIQPTEEEDKFSWILTVPVTDIVEVSWLKPGDRVLIFEGSQSASVLRKGSVDTLPSMPSSSSIFDPSASALGFASPEERLIAEQPSLAYTAYIVAAPVAKPRIEEPPKPPAPVEPTKKGKKAAAPEPIAPSPPPPTLASATYHVPLTLIPEDRYAEYETALNGMMDPENAAERTVLDNKFLLRGDKPSARAPRPTPLVLGTVVLDESVAGTMLARSRGQKVKSALELVFSGPFGGSAGLGRWAGGATPVGGAKK